MFKEIKVRILIATEKPFAKQAISEMHKKIKASKNEMVLLENYTSSDEMIQAATECDALIIRSDKVTDEVLTKASRVQIVVRAGAGYDNVDLESAKQNKVVVMNTPGQNSNAVAELVLGFCIFAYRNFFGGSGGRELQGKKFGVQGYGNIASILTKKGKTLGMEVYAHSRHSQRAIADGAIFIENVSSFYSTCDIVSLHLPSNSQTNSSIGFELLSKMPSNGLLINSARKEIVNEDELLQVMEQKREFKYFADIAPTKAEIFRSRFGDRFFSPPKKMGAQTAEANINAGVAAVEQIVKYFESGDRTFQVN